MTSLMFWSISIVKNTLCSYKNSKFFVQKSFLIPRSSRKIYDDDVNSRLRVHKAQFLHRNFVTLYQLQLLLITLASKIGKKEEKNSYQLYVSRAEKFSLLTFFVTLWQLHIHMLRRPQKVENSVIISNKWIIPFFSNLSLHNMLSE